MAWQVQTEKRNKLAALAKARAREKQIPLAVALAEISREYPQLVAEAREEVLGRTLRRRTIGNGQTIVDVDLAAKLAAMAHARSREKSISYSAALSEISSELPEFLHAVREQVLGRRV